MISANDLLLSYKDNKSRSNRITSSKDVKILCWSEDDSSGDEYVKKKINRKKKTANLESNIIKYINNYD